MTATPHTEQQVGQKDLTRLAQFAGWRLGAIAKPGYTGSAWFKMKGDTTERACLSGLDYPHDCDYLTNINTCLELIEAMRREGKFICMLEVDRNGRCGAAFIGFHHHAVFDSQNQDTLPAAICAAVDKYLDSKEGK